MAEFEFAGMTFKGGKMAVVLTALSTLGGASWAGFEFYKDYMDMREIVQNIDVSAIDARNAVIETKLDEAIDYTRDIKNSLKDDITRIERVSDNASSRVKDIQEDIDERLREVSSLTRETEKDVRDTMRDLEDRIDGKMDKLETDLEDKLQKALDNPLAD
jgi:predicted  nucleic acid-binding Zn-ribbon protein